MLDFLYNALYAKITMKGNKATQEAEKPEILCKCGCGKLFPPNRSWQKFYNPTHQKDYWKEIISNQYQLSKKVKELEDKIDQINIPK